MAQTRIFFVTWPDGKVVEGSQTSVGERVAVGSALKACMIEHFFPGIDFTQAYYGSLSQLWSAMEKAGFKLQSFEIDAAGVSY